MTPFSQKIILTVLAVGIYALCAWPPMSGVAEVLKVLAGLIVGAAWVTKPGDGALVEAGKDALRKSGFPPVAMVGLPPIKLRFAWTVYAVLIAIAVAPWILAGCAMFADAKPVLRDVNDIARELCEATMSAEAQREGVRVEDFCLLPYVFAPFLEAPNRASANAVLGRELECQ